MTTTVRASSPADRVGTLSVLTVSLTVALAAITHAYEFGPPAFLVGGIAIALLTTLGLGYQRTGNRFLIALYALLNLWVIGGFGMVGGLWNHTVKVALCAAHGGTLPSSLEAGFMSPELGSAAYETVGILTFVASLVAAVFGYRFIRSEPVRRGALT